MGSTTPVMLTDSSAARKRADHATAAGRVTKLISDPPAARWARGHDHGRRRRAALARLSSLWGVEGGLIYLTRGLAKALAPEVLVNAVSPGTVLPPESASPEDIAGEVKRTALKRLPTPEDVARAVAFLCAADAITGQILAVESGKLLG